MGVVPVRLRSTHPRHAERRPTVIPVKPLMLVIAAVVVLSGYVVEGLGYHRVSRRAGRAAIESGEGEVYGAGVGLAVELVLWPVFLAADGLNGRDCG